MNGQKVTPSGGTPTTSIERAERTRQIADAREEGASWKAIATRFGVSVKTAQRARAEHLRAAALVEPNALDQFKGAEILARVIGAQLGALDRLEQLAANADSSSAGVGACRAISSTGADLIDSLVQAGRLPDRSEGYELRLRSETAKIMAAVYRLMSELDIPRERLGPAVEAERALAKRV